ncbi:MAG: serine/threonine-protein kinase, partial [Myxococcota bacterium]
MGLPNDDGTEPIDDGWGDVRPPPPLASSGDTAETRSDVIMPIEGVAVRDRLIAGRYAILDVVGAGGMGAVYAAWDERLERKVAIKMLRTNAAAGSVGALRLEREARALARLNHDNVVRVFDVGTASDGPFLAMELIEGQSLEAELRLRRRSREDIVSLFLAAGRGLAAAHRLGIVHRDVKSANILLGADGRPRVGDFGIAAYQGQPVADEHKTDDTPLPHSWSNASGPRVTEEGALLGTPACMAPEQLRGELVDGRSDQYSFCIALHTAVFGEDPFPAKDTLLARYERMKAPPAVPERRWPSLERVLVRGLRFAPAERFPSMEELLTALDATLRERARRQQRVVAALCVCLVTVAAIGIGRTQDHDPCGLAAQEQQVRRLKGATTLPAFLEGDVDAWLGRWSSVAHGTCRATSVDGVQRSRTLDCLEAQLDDLKVLLSLLEAESMEPEVAQQATHSLLRPEVCLDGLGYVRATTQQREGLARARVALFAGDLQGARERALAVREEAKATGAEALFAEVAWVLGRAETGLGQLDDAAATLREGVAAALAARSPRVEAALWVALVDVLVDKQKRLEEGLLVLPMMQAAVRRL